MSSHAARDHWIAERVLDWSGVPSIHIRPTFFSEWLLFPFVRSTIVQNDVIDLPYGQGRHAPISGHDQARVIATLLTEPTAHVGKIYTLCGPTEVDQAGLAEVISEVVGRKISYRPLTIPLYRRRLEEAGLPEFMIQHFCAVAVDYQNGLFAGEDEIITQLTGESPMGIREFVVAHRRLFQSSKAMT